MVPFKGNLVASSNICVANHTNGVSRYGVDMAFLVCCMILTYIKEAAGEKSVLKV